MTEQFPQRPDDFTLANEIALMMNGEKSVPGVVNDFDNSFEIIAQTYNIPASARPALKSALGRITQGALPRPDSEEELTN
ncbi:MAG: hypothetical protein WC757_04135 [Candidatus Paceibacterota bacterium]|jgi:hypothetical protein